MLDDCFLGQNRTDRSAFSFHILPTRGVSLWKKTCLSKLSKIDTASPAKATGIALISFGFFAMVRTTIAQTEDVAE